MEEKLKNTLSQGNKKFPRFKKLLTAELIRLFVINGDEEKILRNRISLNIVLITCYCHF